MDRFYIGRLQDDRGFSLVELMLVLSIFAVVMMATMSLYVPAQRTTSVQTQLSDVQSNLRLAAKVMTQDLLTAGFMVPSRAIIFPDATPYDNPPNIGIENPTEFIIRTRIVGSGFGRTTNAVSSGSYLDLTIAHSDMLENFPVGSTVRLFQPVSTGDSTDEIVSSDASGAYTVVPSSTLDMRLSPGVSIPTALIDQMVMVRVIDDSQPALQTIHYQFSDGALKRIINSSQTQVVARNIADVNFGYGYTGGVINRVDIELTGETRAVQAEGSSGIHDAKSRSVITTVKLRNVY